jgi:hypothetical protein
MLYLSEDLALFVQMPLTSWMISNIFNTPSHLLPSRSFDLMLPKIAQHIAPQPRMAAKLYRNWCSVTDKRFAYVLFWSVGQAYPSNL